MTCFTRDFEGLLKTLVDFNTVSPLETGCISALPDAHNALWRFLERYGFERIYFGTPSESALIGAPLAVTRAAENIGEAFLTSQPNSVFRFGKEQPRERTLMFNFHMDTVSGEVTPRMVGSRFYGRGTVDSKGPGVALLSGVVAAFASATDMLDDIQVLVQCVSGEEGGAMGFYGTRLLMQLGYSGRLNVFAEPTGLRFMDVATATMTLEVAVRGLGSTDDAPEKGDNATLLLSHIVSHLAKRLARPLERLGVRMCVAGVHTGTDHNRVYGEGTLKLNFAYPTTTIGHEVKALVDDTIDQALARFREKFSGTALFANTADRLESIVRPIWLKHSLPVLDNRDAEMESLLVSDIRLLRVSDPREAFTSDAIWGGGSDGYSIVFGPGDLGKNGAHTPDEFVDLSDLASYAEKVKLLVEHFAGAVAQRGWNSNVMRVANY
jgi:acetylornithine deacetylase/succinyl-diaminopimelate desuccinylase-like protein